MHTVSELTIEESQLNHAFRDLVRRNGLAAYDQRCPRELTRLNTRSTLNEVHRI